MLERRSSSHPTLDEVWKDITQGAKESVIAENHHLAARQLDPVADATVMQLLGTIERSVAHHETEPSSLLAESALSARQKRLPKLSLQMFGSLAAVFLLVVGAGSATVLTQQSQDVRQQASDGRLANIRVSPSPDSNVKYPYPVSYEEDQSSEQKVKQQRSPVVWIGGFLIALSIVLLLGLFVWLFAV